MKSKRDPRIDVLRGLALIIIFIDHVPENLYSFYTMRMYGFADAAEAFVLISGISAGLAYSGRFVAGSVMATAKRIWRRAGTIYGAHVFSTLLVLALATPFLVRFGMEEFADVNGLSWLWKQPLATISGSALLTYQVSYFNILPLYVLLFAALPALLFLGTRSIGLMLAVSTAIWLAARYFELRLPAYPGEWAWYFNPFCWQLLFALGLAIGIAARRGRALVAFHPALYAVAVTFVLYALWWRLSGEYSFPFPALMPEFIADTSKETLGLPRIAHIMALTYIVVYMPGLRRFLSLPLFEPINVMGRASLATFVTGSLIAFALQIFREMTGITVLGDTLLLLAGLTVQYYAARAALARAGKARAAIPSAITPPATVMKRSG
ncbi:OpgC family protein [Martelella soudanensis]|uniref:OpgC family protein n=1 Tax=unclassified Martelella TaxID=2629616 RepID=UPI0015DEEA04|nr:MULTISPECIES: OpgC domain-containing protein [unclassified Martelella]